MYFAVMILCGVLLTLAIGPGQTIVALEASPRDFTLSIGVESFVCAPLLEDEIRNGIVGEFWFHIAGEETRNGRVILISASIHKIPPDKPTTTFISNFLIL